MKSLVELGFMRTPKPVAEPSRHLAPGTGIQVHWLAGVDTGIPVGGSGGVHGPPVLLVELVELELLGEPEVLVELELLVEPELVLVEAPPAPPVDVALPGRPPCPPLPDEASRSERPPQPRTSDPPSEESATATSRTGLMRLRYGKRVAGSILPSVAGSPVAPVPAEERCLTSNRPAPG
jgi:hypothetical protein